MRKPVLKDKDIVFINKNYQNMKGSEMARKIGCRGNVVRDYMRKNGLSKPRKKNKINPGNKINSGNKMFWLTNTHPITGFAVWGLKRSNY